MKLLGIGTDSKTVKGEKYGYLTGILYLAPGNISGFEVCPNRSEGCSKACLYTAGRGRFSNVQTSRIRKTKMFFENREQFLTDLRKDIEALVLKAEAQGLKPCVRLNGTSDLGWEGIARDIMQDFPNVWFYDYTKSVVRMAKFLSNQFPANYHLTLSRSESNWDNCLGALGMGGNVAVVFDKVPDQYEGYEVIDGDLNDLRFLDAKGTIVGLKAKGDAKQDQSGFVVHA